MWLTFVSLRTEGRLQLKDHRTAEARGKFTSGDAVLEPNRNTAMLPKRKFILRSSVDTRRKSFALNGNASEGTKVLGGNE